MVGFCMTKCVAPLLRRAGALGIALREEGAPDRPFTRMLYASTRNEELAAVDWSDEEKDRFLSWQHDAQHDHYRRHYEGAGWFIIERSGRPAGRLYLVRWDDEIRIIDIALAPAERRQGRGSSILLDLIEEAAASKARISIHVEKLNPAMTLYGRLGFKLVEDKGVYLLLARNPV